MKANTPMLKSFDPLQKLRCTLTFKRCASARWKRWTLNVECSLLNILLVFVTSVVNGKAQPAQQLDPLLQIMISQPSIDVTSNVQITATFDPPIVRPGEKAIYRVNINALGDSVDWPAQIASPPELNLRLSTRGQTLYPADNKLRPQTTFLYHARPSAGGVFTVPGYEVTVYGRRFTVPAARLEANAAAPSAAPRSLTLEVSNTNVFVGQPVRVRVLMYSQTADAIEGLQDVNISGEGFLHDRGTATQAITRQPRNGQLVPAYSYEATLSPLIAGDLTLFGQGFTSGNRFAGQITITGGQITIPGGPPQVVLLESDRVTIHARPLPRVGELPGFNGAIGRFTIDAPQLSTNRVRVGESMKLSVTVRGEGNFPRLMPPRPPVSTNWQVTEAVPGTPVSLNPTAIAGPSKTFVYTLSPINAKAETTPAIPFSAFDPDRATYVDLTIPALPIQVLPSADSIDPAIFAKLSQDNSAGESKLKLSDLTNKRGRTVTTLMPLQLRPWFVGVQLLPIFGFVALWRWDKRRRFLEQHPEIVLRRKARRALQRGRRELQNAFESNDATRFAAAAVNAMRIAAAPYFPAESRALVGRDILEALANNGESAEVVQHFFQIADAAQFSTEQESVTALLNLRGELDRVLDELEAKL
jgi:hypothetical protein